MLAVEIQLAVKLAVQKSPTGSPFVSSSFLSTGQQLGKPFHANSVLSTNTARLKDLYEWFIYTPVVMQCRPNRWPALVLVLPPRWAAVAPPLWAETAGPKAASAALASRPLAPFLQGRPPKL